MFWDGAWGPQGGFTNPLFPIDQCLVVCFNRLLDFTRLVGTSPWADLQISKSSFSLVFCSQIASRLQSDCEKPMETKGRRSAEIRTPPSLFSIGFSQSD